MASLQSVFAGAGVDHSPGASPQASVGFVDRAGACVS
jgi:hypothetical protein